ncbi:MAG: hypothetical protein ABSF66_06250 [Terriglobales bacterium]
MVRVSGQQQPPARRTVSAWKASQFLIETLEAQAEAERTAIFEEEASGLFDVFGECDLKQIDLAPIAMAPITTTPIVLNKIAFAGTRGRHWRTSKLYPEAPPILSLAQSIAPGARDN